MTETDLDLELDQLGRRALDFLAGVIVALAIFALPISIILFATGHGHAELVGLFVVACLVTLAAVARFAAVRGRAALGLVAGAGLIAWGAALIAGFVVLADRMDSNTCTGNGAGLAGDIGAIAIYAAVGGWSLTQRRSLKLALIVLPAAAVLGLTCAGLVWHYGPVMPGCYND